MNLEHIIKAVDSGEVVHWKNTGYRVIRDSIGQLLIIWDYKGRSENCIGLTQSDFKTLNGHQDDFYTA